MTEEEKALAKRERWHDAVARVGREAVWFARCCDLADLVDGSNPKAVDMAIEVMQSARDAVSDAVEALVP